LTGVASVQAVLLPCTWPVFLGVFQVEVPSCFVLLVLASRVRFDTPFGFTVATQLAFVPLVFAMPVTLVLFAVVLALVTARTPELLAGKIRASRMLLTVGNAWFAIGPVAVFVLAGISPGEAGPLLLVAALAAQFLVDFTVSAARNWIARGRRPEYPAA
jgi:hypothetical protein